MKLLLQEESCRKGDPLSGPESGSCLTRGDELSEEIHRLT